ncbi:hypothetical protein [Streptomyces sp. AM6-12]|uniref:hypothetical protein n=1 Tax=Streptomyces sp. AM6-12 TaxID=3345149 RepID=UPI0037B8A465
MSRKGSPRERGAARRRLAKERGWTYTDWHPERMRLCAGPLGVDAGKAMALDAVSGTLDGLAANAETGRKPRRARRGMPVRPEERR